MKLKKTIISTQEKIDDSFYSINNYVKVLWREVKSNTRSKDFYHLPEEKKHKKAYDKAIRELFCFTYEICNLAAINKPYLKTIYEMSSDTEKKAIRYVLREYEINIKGLRMIFLGEMKKGLAKGLTQTQAAKEIVEHSKKCIQNWEDWRNI